MSKKKTPPLPIQISDVKGDKGRTIEAKVTIREEGFTLSDELAKGRKIPSLHDRIEKAITEAISEHEVAGMRYIAELEQKVKLAKGV